MIGRRLFLQLFGGLFALVATRQVVSAKVQLTSEVPPLEPFAPDIVLPPWCPLGFVPEVGQTISASQFPALFKRDGKFWPPYHSRRNAQLAYSVVWPDVSTSRAHGYQDKLTIIKREPDRRVRVGLLAATPQISSNGRVLRPGWSATVLVDPEEFLGVYPHAGPGLDLGPAETFVAFDGYSPLDTLRART